MKFILVGNHSVDYSSESHHYRSLESLGLDIVPLQEGVTTGEEILDNASRSHGLIFIHTHGWSTPGKPLQKVLLELKKMGIPTISYHLDLWLGLQRQRDLSRDPIYRHIQHFFTVDKRMADYFNKFTQVKGHYLPAGIYDAEAYLDKPTDIKDVIFIGSKAYHREWPYRPKLINWLEYTYGDRFIRYNADTPQGSVRGAALNQAIANAKIVIGDSLCVGFNYPDYWSDRVYETLGRGGFLIMPFISGLEREFNLDPANGTPELITYKFNDFTMLKQLIDFYLEHDRERLAIKEAGFKKVKENYTYQHRWRTILKELGLAQGLII